MYLLFVTLEDLLWSNHCSMLGPVVLMGTRAGPLIRWSFICVSGATEMNESQNNVLIKIELQPSVCTQKCCTGCLNKIKTSSDLLYIIYFIQSVSY